MLLLVELVLHLELEEWLDSLNFFFVAAVHVPGSMLALGSEDLLEEWVSRALVVDLEMPDCQLHVVLVFLCADVLGKVDILPGPESQLGILFDQQLLSP